MGSTMEFSKVFMQNLPIPNASAGQKAEVTSLADQILDLKSADANADVGALEERIDQIVYTLFELTGAEIALVERRE